MIMASYFFIHHRYQAGFSNTSSVVPVIFYLDKGKMTNRYPYTKKG